MFYGNYAAKYVKRLTFDANGNVTGTQPFATNWPGVDLELGPGNEIYYTNFADGSNGTGSVRQIVYVARRQLDADRAGERDHAESRPGAARRDLQQHRLQRPGQRPAHL